MGKEMQFFFYQKHLKNKKGIPRREGKGVWEDYFKSQTLDQKDKACCKYIYTPVLFMKAMVGKANIYSGKPNSYHGI